MKEKIKKPLSDGKLIAIALSVSIIIGLVASSFMVVETVKAVANLSIGLATKINEGLVKGNEALEPYSVNGDVKSISVNWINGNVYFKYDKNVEKVVLSEKGNRKLKDGEHMYVDFDENGKLSVSSFGKNILENTTDKDLTITLPEKYKNGNIDDVQLACVDTDISGEVYADSFSGNLADCKLEIANSSFKNVKLNCADCTVNIANSKTAFDLKANAAESKIYIYLPDDAEFTLETTQHSKTFINGFNCSKSKHTYVCGAGTADMKVNGYDVETRVAKFSEK